MVPVFDTPIVVNGKKETAHQYFMRDYKDFFKAQYELQMHLGEYVNQFAYPYGWGTRTPLIALKEAGYHFIFTTSPGDVTQRTNPDAIPRIDIGYSSESPEQAIQDILWAAGVHNKQPSAI